MGRGRAKAKQVKVARQLKYSSGNTDLDRLQKELGVPDSPADDAYDELAEKYADYADDYEGQRKNGTSGH